MAEISEVTNMQRLQQLNTQIAERQGQYQRTGLVGRGLTKTTDQVGITQASQTAAENADKLSERRALIEQQAQGAIRDADAAYEQLSLSKSQILQNTGIAMLAQANQAPQQLLQLFR